VIRNTKIYNKKAILFDLDGTLIDSVPDLTLAINDMLLILGRKTFAQDVIKYWVGNGANVLVKRALSGNIEINKSLDKKLIEEALEIFLKSYSNHLAEATITYPYVIETLTELKQRKYRLVIITNKPSAFVLPILKSLNIDNLFEFYLGGDTLKEKKPNPEPLYYACNKLNININDAVMVGDSKNDILASNSAKMQSIGVTYGYNYGESLSDYNPTNIIDNFEELLSIFEERKDV